MTDQATAIAANLEAVYERIRRAAKRARRKPEEVTLVAVSKTFPAERIREAHAAGVRHFGENRVQEWDPKHALLEDLDATWHLVGHLQNNKAARALKLFHAIDSLDRMELAQRLERLAGEAGKRIPVLAEVRLAPEKTKSGIAEAELPRLVEAVLSLPKLELRGLMCIPPPAKDPEQTRPYFRRLRELRDAMSAQFKIPMAELSMGMSDDFEVAIEEGATQIRLGTAVFGPRAGR
jgi:pyridoxal phosphate enzyme (YggS family)